MKTRESGMPDEASWEAFFDPEYVLSRLTVTSGDIVEFGCGYGTFTIPAAMRTAGLVYAFDIDPEMVAAVRAKAVAAGVSNVRPLLRDFAVDGTGLPDATADYAMLFNILHCESPALLLREARRLLRPDGLLGIMHWKYDASTPRGPSMGIRPRPEQCRAWAIDADFDPLSSGIIDLPPYHYGMVLRATPR
jgi:SAM-dependent methyltransferase